MIPNAAGLAPLAILLIVGLFFLITLLLQWLWNITMPDVFGLKSITFWQAFRLLIISGILFGGPTIMGS
ncbi:MAG: hypothetical protein K9L17_09085 [Clostridiales bacterium]|nr:hypothetical protein [Clostridiales bacterium]MCF8022831.1 hypothetical protein [Clostridiales bacterium]